MKKKVLYHYLGTNGTILSPVHLEDTYYVRKLELQADKDKYLTKDGIEYHVRVVIPEDELSEWYEVNK